VDRSTDVGTLAIGILVAQVVLAARPVDQVVTNRGRRRGAGNRAVSPGGVPSNAGAIEYVKVLLSITVMVCTPLNVVGVAPEIVIDSPW